MLFRLCIFLDKVANKFGSGTGKGRIRLIKTPEKSWDKFSAYRKDVEDHPPLNEVIFRSQE